MVIPPMLNEGEKIVPMRLQRFLARAGVASRRGSERLMTSGRVRVNGVVVTELGSKVDPAVDVVTVDGVTCSIERDSAFVMLYKPAGYVTTMSDPQGRPTVAELVPTQEYPGLYPVGRLDADTTGLLLFTTDGNAGNQLLHPSRHVDKHYVALVRGRLSKEDVRRLEEGIMLEEGQAAPATVETLDETSPLFSVVAPNGAGADAGGHPNSVVGLTIHEGKKHQVKKMLMACGHRVLRLHRDAFGPLELAGVSEGCWRLLNDAEVCAVRACCEGGEPR